MICKIPKNSYWSDLIYYLQTIITDIKKIRLQDLNKKLIFQSWFVMNCINPIKWNTGQTEKRKQKQEA